MDIDKNDFESTNISEKWMENIYENIRNLENMERLAREGCNSILEYAQLASNPNAHIIIKEVQYKNAKMMLSELQLLLTDIRIIVGETFYGKIKEVIDGLEKFIQKRELFVIENFDTTKGRIISMDLTPMFFKVLKKLCDLRGRVIFEISGTLFLKKEDKSTQILR